LPGRDVREVQHLWGRYMDHLHPAPPKANGAAGTKVFASQAPVHL
jgi:hypothetical protein